MSLNKKTCAVIGSGIAGIAAAIRLSQKGYQITVYEKNNSAGGKLSQFVLDKYRFDFGPSLFTLPEQVNELFHICGKNPSDYFTYSKIDLSHRYFYEDGTTFNAYTSTEKFSEEAHIFFNEDKNAVINYLDNAKQKYNLTKDMFLAKSLHKIKSYLSKASLVSFLHFRKLDSLISLNSANEKYFKNKKLIQFFNRFATYNGSNPYEAPATLGLIPHIEINLGVYYPKGGMFAITEALIKLATEIGVTFCFDTTVEEIIIKDKKAAGIKINQSILQFDIVISNMDIYFTYQKLLPTVKSPLKILNQEKSSSAIVFYWGIKKSFPTLGLHNILWSENYEEEFKSLFAEKWVYKDPTIYINISAKETKEDAPQDCENWFVMINAPHLKGQDWTKLIGEVRKNCIDKINRILKTDIESIIEVEKILTPEVLEQKTMSAFGALYGNSSNNRYASFLRHPNFHPSIKNLYFCGGTVHPGGGIPLCLMSAKIVSGLIKK